MEKIIYKQLLSFSLRAGIIPNIQHGFLPHRSVITCLLCCLNTWTLHVDAADSVDVVYLDFKNPFDRVLHIRLLGKLDHLGIGLALSCQIEPFM